ncbi:MAG: transposon-encoded TnpW family protein [Clostridia bacterium]|nr:transposon-encoded TnpW family protein [Clostridia bacterium]MEE1138270.1 transposon-encoded TnpW family protein [Acutalibacteraceae bacterium]
MDKTKADNNYSYITRRIGATTFKVKVVYNDTGNETMEDKILRIVRNEVLENGEKCGIIELPQMSRQSERSA